MPLFGGALMDMALPPPSAAALHAKATFKAYEGVLQEDIDSDGWEIPPLINGNLEIILV